MFGMELNMLLGLLGAGTNCWIRFAATGSKHAVGIWLFAPKSVVYESPAVAPRPQRPFRMFAKVWSLMEPVRPVAEKSPVNSAGEGTTTGSAVTPATCRLPS